MSSGTITPTQPPQGEKGPARPPVQESELAALIDRRLLTTRRQVKGSDIVTGMLTLVVGALGYLLAAAVADQWLISGGLGFWGRFLLWAVLVGGLGYYFVKRVWPTIAYRINPIFAAQTIEQSRPTLKNSLINFLLMRSHRGELAPVIYQALEQRAASDLSRTPVEGTVDQRRLLHRGYVLAALVIVFCAYLILSPKNPFVSAARVLWPWSPLHAPTRVTIEDVRPGNAAAFLGDALTVSAEVGGLRDGEPVLAYFSTADGQIMDQAVPLTRPAGRSRFECRLPPGELGLQQDLVYRLAAGDDRTERYRVTVQIPPVITVEQVDYHYPSYTGLPDRSAARQGDLRAVEGTAVTITAQANQPIRQAWIDLNCDGKRSIPMVVHQRTARGQLTLRLDPRDPEQAEYTSYQIRFINREDRKNLKPIRHRIDVLRDLPPDVKILDPREEKTAVDEDGQVEISVWAEDPDFALRRVALQATAHEKPLALPPLMEHKPPSAPHPGAWEGKFVFEPKRWGLRRGDTVTYWAAAEDNKEPTPGRSDTADHAQQLIIVGPEKPPPENPRQQPHPAARPPQPKPPSERSQDQTEQQPPEKSNSQESNPESPQAQPDPDRRQPQPPGKEGEPPPEDPQNSQESSSEEESSAAKQGSENANPPERRQGEQPPAGKEEQQSEPGEQNGQQQPGSEEQSGKEPSAQGGEKQGEKSSGAKGESASAQNQEQQSEPIDPNAQPGDAIQKILQHRREDPSRNPSEQSGKEAGGNQQSQARQQGSGEKDQRAGDENQDAGKDQTESGRETGRQQTGGKQQQSGRQQGGGEEAGSEQQTGERSPRTENQASGNQQGGESHGNEKSSGGKPSSANSPSGRQPTGTQTSPEEKTSSDQSASAEESKREPPSGGKEQTGKTAEGGKPEAPPTANGEKGTAQDEKQPGTKFGPGQEKQSSTQGDTNPGTEKPKTSQSAKPGQPPGAGKGSTQPQGTPEPQDVNQPKSKLTQEPSSTKNAPPDQATSPSRSKKQSDSRGETAGDQSGGGAEGGGQHAPKPGQGSAGSQTPSDEGASQARQQGSGEASGRPGQDAESRRPTGSAAKRSSNQATGSGDQGSGKGKSEGQQDAGAQQPGSGSPENQSGQGNQSQTAGASSGQGGTQSGRSEMGKAPPAVESPAEEANLEYARKQTELALRHLDEELSKEKSDLLKELGWTREEARRFLARWSQMRQSARDSGPQGAEAKQKLDDAIRSLGLRPRGTAIGRGGAKSEDLRDLRDAGRFAPPAEWAEQFRAFSRGVAEEGKP
ncbi:MAG: hypothetical protein JXB10_03140 [Pirellulales bacterium]|nr:hypothetical protein [Pirellulales bacterium]